MDKTDLIQLVGVTITDDDLKQKVEAESDPREIFCSVKNITRAEIESVGFQAADYDEMAKKYDPFTLQPGYNTLPDGEEIFFVPNPALGLWVDKERF